MKVIDVIEKCEKDLTTEELIDLVANHNRQVDLILAEKKTDEDGYLTWDAENWTSVDGKRFIRSYSLEGRVLSDFSGYNKYDMKGYFQPETAKEVRLNEEKRTAPFGAVLLCVKSKRLRKPQLSQTLAFSNGTLSPSRCGGKGHSHPQR